MSDDEEPELYFGTGREYFRGKDASFVSSGEERVPFNKRKDKKYTPEEEFEKKIRTVIKEFPFRNSKEIEGLIANAKKIPNYINLSTELLIAAISFRNKLSVRSKFEDITPEFFEENAMKVLGPLATINPETKSRMKGLDVEQYRVKLKAALLRYVQLVMS